MRGNRKFRHLGRVTCARFLTYVEFGDVKDFPPADHVLPLDGEFKRIRPLSRRDKLRAQKPEKQTTKTV